MSAPSRMALLVPLLMLPGVLSGQSGPRLDSTQVAQARLLCGPLSDDSVRQNALWLAPPDALFSTKLAGIEAPMILPFSSAILEFPDHLRRQGVQGRVIATAIVNADGRVEPGTVKVSETPHPDFVPVTVRYFERSRFRPGQLNGRPVRVCIVTPIDFRTRGS